MKIYPYMNGSKSARALADGLGIKILKKHGPDRKEALIINWGCSKFERNIGGYKILNNPANVAVAANKLRTFEWFRNADVPTVEWTTSREHALQWFMAQEKVVVRHKLTGHSGEGIEIVDGADPDAELPDAPLYTKYTKKKEEYRIHVFQGEVIFQQRKARKKDVPDEQVNWQVRNLAGGFIFANDGVIAPDVVTDSAIAAVASLALDFGAVDVGYKDGVAYVYEVNTACGLEGKNLQAYVKKFEQFK